MKNNKPPQFVQSLDRALDILEILAVAEHGLGVTEISNRVGLHKSTVYRLLATLAYRGYVKQNDNNRYQIGLKLFEVGSLVLNNLDLRTQARPYLEKLMEETNETIHLGILDQNEIVYIDKVESSKTIRMYSQTGKRVPIHCTSLGKVILAFSEPALTEKVLDQTDFPAFTANTITDLDQFRKHLVLVQEQGYAVDDEEQEEGIRCIGGPILNYDGQVIAAFSISGPAMRMTGERVESLKELVKNYSSQLSRAFGYKK